MVHTSVVCLCYLRVDVTMRNLITWDGNWNQRS